MLKLKYTPSLRLYLRMCYTRDGYNKVCMYVRQCMHVLHNSTVSTLAYNYDVTILLSNISTQFINV